MFRSTKCILVLFLIVRAYIISSFIKNGQVLYFTYPYTLFKGQQRDQVLFLFTPIQGLYMYKELELIYT